MATVRLAASVRRVLVRGLPPAQAAVAGGVLVIALALVVGLLEDTIGHAAQALVLVVPVMLTAALGGRRPAWFVAALATLTFLVVLPPVGTLKIHLAEDIVALVVFSVVAFTVGGLVAQRVDVLGRLERQRAALLRSVSHDLRTPLAAIRAAASELQEKSSHSVEQQGRMLAMVEDEAERLDRLVGNLLSLARIEGGGLEPRRQAVDIVELVQLCTVRLSKVLAETGVVVDAPPDLPLVFADHTLLEQVVTNLIENAVRHSPPGASVDIAVRADTKVLELVVADGGPGVSADDLNTIFEPFRSGTSAGMSGIGLAICKAVVEAHGGTILVGDSSRGGAAFTVSLPIQ
jgi:K+-sensing histidine kinase KdpD